MTSCQILQEDPELAEPIGPPERERASVLSDLVAARRPTVTTSLSELAKLGLVRAEGNRWLLSGEPPGELLELETINPAAEKQPA